MIKEKRGTHICTRKSENILGSCKRSQLFGMPFSVIFSIFLIIFFIIAAFIAVKIFWCPWCKDCTFYDQSQEGMLKEDLQRAIDEVWNSAGSDMPLKISLPSKIEKVCFLNYGGDGDGKNSALFDELKGAGNGNVYLYPTRNACDGFRYMNLKHVNITETTKTENPLCVDNGDEFWIKSEHGGLVKIYYK